MKRSKMKKWLCGEIIKNPNATVIVIAPQKSILVAMLLSILAGPFGVLYANVRAALWLMLPGLLVVATNSPVLMGIYLVACMIIAVHKTNQFNLQFCGQHD